MMTASEPRIYPCSVCRISSSEEASPCLKKAAMSPPLAMVIMTHLAVTLSWFLAHLTEPIKEYDRVPSLTLQAIGNLLEIGHLKRTQTRTLMRSLVSVLRTPLCTAWWTRASLSRASKS
jgi:hypothetical protein